MKNERVYRMKSENLRSWTIHIKYLSDVPVSRNWYKTVSNFRLVTWFPSVLRDNDTAMLLAEALVTYYGLYVIILSIISIKSAKKIKIILGANLRFSGSCGIGCVFVEYDLCNILQLLYNIAYISIFVKFDTVLYQFLETGTSDRYVLYRYRSILEILRF